MFHLCPRHLGKIQGLGTGIGIVAVGIGPILFGLAADHLDSYTPPILGCAALLTVCNLSILTVKTSVDALPKVQYSTVSAREF